MLSRGKWMLGPPGLSKLHWSLALHAHFPRFKMKTIGHPSPTPIFTRKREGTTSKTPEPQCMRNGPGPPGLQPSQRQWERHTLFGVAWRACLVACFPSEEEDVLSQFRAAIKESFKEFIPFDGNEIGSGLTNVIDGRGARQAGHDRRPGRDGCRNLP